jgi:mono/diheme cytochrome c family protein
MRCVFILNVKRLTFNVGFLMFLVGLMAAIFSPPRLLASPPAQSPDAPPSVSAGRALWPENCLPCHGSSGQGNGPAAQEIPNPLPNLADPATMWPIKPADYFGVIKNGRIDKLMPPWGNRLSDTQIWDLTAYVWSLGVKPADLAAGEALYADQCAACHGVNGIADGPKASAGIVNFTDLGVMSQRSQADLQAIYQTGNPHRQVSLSAAELRQVLDYVRTFSFKMPQRNGVLKGQVINATTNQPQGNLDVTLRVFEGNNEIETHTTGTDASGNFSFDKLLTDHSTFYLVEGRFQGVDYFSDQPAIFTPNSTETTLNLNVYEPTTDPQAIRVNQLHYLLSFTPGQANVVQIFVLQNDRYQTYVGQKGQTFQFNLPQNAQDVTFQDDGAGVRFVETADGYADTAPVVPGQDKHSIVAVYSLPYEDTLTVAVPLPADVSSASVVMEERGATLQSSQLAFVETRDFQGRPYAIYNGSNFKKGQALNLQLSGLDNLTFADESSIPTATVTGSGLAQEGWLWLILGIGGVVIVAVAVGYPRLRPRLPQPDESPFPLEDPNLRRQKLLVLLARLDELFEAGELDKPLYHRARARFKAELMELMEG